MSRSHFGNAVPILHARMETDSISTFPFREVNLDEMTVRRKDLGYEKAVQSGCRRQRRAEIRAKIEAGMASCRGGHLVSSEQVWADLRTWCDTQKRLLNL
jgi:hypothetical protein